MCSGCLSYSKGKFKHDLKRVLGNIYFNIFIDLLEIINEYTQYIKRNEISIEDIFLEYSFTIKSEFYICLAY